MKLNVFHEQNSHLYFLFCYYVLFFRWNCHLWLLGCLWFLTHFLERLIKMPNFAPTAFSVIVHWIQNCPVWERKWGVEVPKRTHLEVLMWLLGWESQHLESQLYPGSTRPGRHASHQPARTALVLLRPLCLCEAPGVAHVDGIITMNTTCWLLIRCSLTPWSDSYLLLPSVSSQTA